MRRTKPSGLVVSGQLSESTLLRLPALSEDLGPVAASSRRLASRYANALRRGWAAGDWSELSAARIIFIQIPAQELPEALEHLLKSVRPWQRRIAVLLDETLDCSSLAPLAGAGAFVASLAHVPMAPNDVALIDGDSQAVSGLRPILRRSAVKTIHMKNGSKNSYNAGVMLGASLAGVVADMVMRAVRGAGVDPAAAKRIVSQSVDASMRQALAKSKSVWDHPRTSGEKALVLKQLLALESSDHRAGACLRETMAAALLLYGEDAKWLRKHASAAGAVGAD
jgi:hypothetical protein